MKHFLSTAIAVLMLALLTFTSCSKESLAPNSKPETTLNKLSATNNATQANLVVVRFSGEFPDSFSVTTCDFDTVNFTGTYSYFYSIRIGTDGQGAIGQVSKMSIKATGVSTSGKTYVLSQNSTSTMASNDNSNGTAVYNLRIRETNGKDAGSIKYSFVSTGSNNDYVLHVATIEYRCDK